jgi:hypothetical protein
MAPRCHALVAARTFFYFVFLSLAHIANCSCPEHSQPDASGSECVCNAGYSLQNCQDDLSWSDVNNASCSTYLAKAWCGYGLYTGTDSPGFPLDTRDRDCIDASEACCICGKAGYEPGYFNPTPLSTVCTACSGDTFKETVGNSATEPGCTLKDGCCVCPAFSQTPGMRQMPRHAVRCVPSESTCLSALTHAPTAMQAITRTSQSKLLQL